MPRHFGILSPLPSENREAFLCVTVSITEYQSAKSLGTPSAMPVLSRHPHRMDNGISLVAPHSPCLSLDVAPVIFHSCTLGCFS